LVDVLVTGSMKGSILIGCLLWCCVRVGGVHHLGGQIQTPQAVTMHPR
jgi:hypothetical protein